MDALDRDGCHYRRRVLRFSCELPVVRIIAALLAAMPSGAAISTLPPAGFRVARLVTCLIFPLSWLWVGYVAASFLIGATRFGTLLSATLAAALVDITTCAWAHTTSG
jgi:hypothetical protein